MLFPNGSSLGAKIFYRAKVRYLARSSAVQYPLVAVGGTFDVLHAGHRALLRKAFEHGRNVAIGLTSDQFVKKAPKRHMTRSYAKRRGQLCRFLDQEGLTSRSRIVPLNDIYGEAVRDAAIKALVVSQETVNNGERINEIRIAGGLPPLSIICVDLVLADDGKPISTTRVREGQITCDGKVPE